ncbi:ABC transporter permease [Burkholderia multivorans]|uniref:ABC transporter permease n=1 Tax=Burkholderia ubonensis TaxID=101571 RepID=UPI0009B48A26|nr:ABC transporter permease [Burkholderia ubonensis]AYZ66579.1 ABC transporter permease [Burkholderia multivorans]VWC00391.1 peptide ABC transporter permease [Burkholderia ubonensis]
MTRAPASTLAGASPGGGSLRSAARRFATGLGRALGALALTSLGLLLVTFLIGRASPIDPVLKVVGDHASPETYRAARHAMGLDRPLAVQFVRYVRDALHGDLGQSTSTGRPVLVDLLTYFPATLELATLSILFGVLLGVPAGVWAAQRHNRAADHAIRIVALVGYSVPVFWLGLMGLLVFYSKLGWVAGPGRLDDVYLYTVPAWSNAMLIDTLRAGNAQAFGNAVRHLVLPVALLAFFSIAYIARITRALTLEEIGKEYVLTARAKGAPTAHLLWRHVMPNIAAPLVTVIALSYAMLLEGAVLTETVFSWQGIGLYMTNALFAADMPAVLGGTLLIGLAFVTLNACADFISHLIEPRSE